MKPIMEGWRHYLAESSEHLLTEAEAKRAKDYVDAIKRTIIVLGAKAAGKEFLNQAITEVGPEIAEAALEWAKAIPGIGTFIAGPAAIWKTGKATFKTLMSAKEIGKAAFDVLKVAADDFVGMDDSKVGTNPIAKLLNIDDRMEVPISEEFLTNFAGILLQHLSQSPNTLIPNPDAFAEQALSNYLKAKQHVGDIEPPPDPN